MRDLTCFGYGQLAAYSKNTTITTKFGLELSGLVWFGIIWFGMDEFFFEWLSSVWCG